jgi:fatty acid desaturase
LHRRSIQFLLEKKAKSTLAESLALGAHFVVYFGLVFSVLEPLQAVLFIAIHRGLFGMYMVFIFAPNHKAMPVLDRDSQLDFLHRQVLTSRNVSAHPITDFWYGGLNYQIEHHLFPRLPRNKLREAQQIVRDFCRDHSIAYHETSVLQSYREILQHLYEGSVRRCAKQEQHGDDRAGANRTNNRANGSTTRRNGASRPHCRVLGCVGERRTTLSLFGRLHYY